LKIKSLRKKNDNLNLQSGPPPREGHLRLLDRTQDIPSLRDSLRPYRRRRRSALFYSTRTA